MKKLKILSAFFAFAAIVLMIQSCRKNLETVELKSEVLVLPTETYFYESGNQNDSSWNEKATLGRVLFYDKNLSATNAVACASCHFQENAFADGKRFSSGFTMQFTERNSMAFSNLTRDKDFFWDARETDLNEMVLKPISNHVEMGLTDMNVLVKKLAQNPKYVDLFNAAYGSINQENLADAISTFLLSIKSNNSRFDNEVLKPGFWRNTQNFKGFSPDENKGLELFIQHRCYDCHDPSSNFERSWSNYANIGLELNYKDKGVDIDAKFGGPKNSVSGNEGFFKIPSLRNVALTAPYMHDGRFETLEQVIEHYNSGVVLHKNLSYQLFNYHVNEDGSFTRSPRRLNLSEDDKRALVAFLKTLTDHELIHDVRFSNPFKTVD